jgi:hypothetical protein
MRLLEIQNPSLAGEEVWAHATPGPERGGLLIAAPDAPELLGSERYWQVRRGSGGGGGSFGADDKSSRGAGGRQRAA